MKYLSSIFFTISFITFLILPHLQGSVIKLNPYKLGGYERNVSFPIFTLETFTQGLFQDQVARHIAQQIGLRSYFIRTDNQISLSIFNQTSPKTNPEVTIGKDKVLFETAYIKSLNNKYIYNPSQLEELAKNLLKIQNYLKSKNKAFVLLISPSKAEIYKEKIHSSYINKEKPYPDKLNEFRKNLSKLGIKHLDGPAYFTELKSKLSFPIFSNTGTHWSYYPTCLFIKELITEVEKQISSEMLNLNCGEPNIIRSPVGTDKDILGLLNIWKPRDFFSQNHYSKSSIIEDQTSKRPRVLIIGTSFVWQILKYVDTYHLFSQRDFLYYFDVNHSNRGFIKKGKVNKNELDLASVIENKDVILIEINEIKLDEMGYGFIEKMLELIESSST